MAGPEDELPPVEDVHVEDEHVEDVHVEHENQEVVPESSNKKKKKNKQGVQQSANQVWSFLLREFHWNSMRWDKLLVLDL